MIVWFKVKSQRSFNLKFDSLKISRRLVFIHYLIFKSFLYNIVAFRQVLPGLQHVSQDPGKYFLS